MDYENLINLEVLLTIDRNRILQIIRSVIEEEYEKNHQKVILDNQVLELLIPSSKIGKNYMF